MVRPRRRIPALVCSCFVTLAGFAAAWEAAEGLQKYAFPGASAQPATARAVEAYYRPGVAAAQSLTAGVFETPAAFQAVSEFYAPQMDPGEWGWRQKTRTLLQQVETLKFMRAQLLAGQGKAAKGLPETFRPLFGDPGLAAQEFAARLDRLVKESPQATIQVAEGTRTLADGLSGSQLRVTVERPYIDVEEVKLVDRTRLVLVRVSGASAKNPPPSSCSWKAPPARIALVGHALAPSMGWMRGMARQMVAKATTWSDPATANTTP
jgi:hypothetical protein